MKRIIATIGLLCVGLSGAGHETNAQVTINIFNLNDVLRAKPIDNTKPRPCRTRSNPTRKRKRPSC